jgi:hypothetical protein
MQAAVPRQGNSLPIAQSKVAMIVLSKTEKKTKRGKVEAG